MISTSLLFTIFRRRSQPKII